jgi:hypothetical protein
MNEIRIPKYQWNGLMHLVDSEIRRLGVASWGVATNRYKELVELYALLAPTRDYEEGVLICQSSSPSKESSEKSQSLPE